MTPAAVVEKTIKSRSPAVTGMLRPVVKPELVVPKASMPVRVGAKVTTAPGIAVNVLLSAGALNNCPVIVNTVPTSDNATVVLKNPEILVIVPARGAEKEKLMSGPNAVPVKSIVPPTMEMSDVEFPNPRRPAVPTNPPAMVVIVIGPPDANGIIAPAP